MANLLLELNQKREPVNLLAELQPEPTIGEQVLGGLQTAGTIASGIVAEPLAGLAGIGTQIGASLGLVDQSSVPEAIEATRSALTLEGGEESQRQLQSIGETLEPVAEVFGIAEEFLGDKAFELTGSPAIAAVAKSLPTAALEILGFKGAKRLTSTGKPVTKKQVTKAIVESAPEVQQLKDVSRQVYQEIDDSGFKIKPKAVDRLISNIDRNTRKAGLDPRTTPRAAGALEVIKDDLGAAQTLTEIDRLRTVAQGVAKNIDPTEAQLGNRMIQEIDDFLDTARPVDFVKGSASAADTAKKFKSARKLWGRARRSELIEEAIVKGESRAAGAEAGIRNELNRILNSKKLSKFFPKDELAAMRSVVKGDFKQNITRLVGKLGLSIDRSPNVFQSIIAGGGLGAVVGGAPGAIAIPVIGTVSKRIAKNLTTKKANFLNNIVRSGENGERIAKAYLNAVPKAKRNVQDLADLLSDPNINIDDLEFIANATIREAAEIAKGRRAINLASSAVAGSLSQQDNEQ